mmetsp:Transcript_480/g.1365  ORF Transcript_480/g.1365 Transcript_480/m.1365 type:complete len:241 (+) Transcript_480:455-1177(+)
MSCRATRLVLHPLVQDGVRAHVRLHDRVVVEEGRLANLEGEVEAATHAPDGCLVRKEDLCGSRAGAADARKDDAEQCCVEEDEGERLAVDGDGEDHAVVEEGGGVKGDTVPDRREGLHGEGDGGLPREVLAGRREAAVLAPPVNCHVEEAEEEDEESVHGDGQREQAAEAPLDQHVEPIEHRDLAQLGQLPAGSVHVDLVARLVERIVAPHEPVPQAAALLQLHVVSAGPRRRIGIEELE